jgi:AraC-like DNA-binding protein
MSSVFCACNNKFRGTLNLEEKSGFPMAKQKDASEDSRAQAAEMRAELARKIAAHIHLEGKEATGVQGLSLYRKAAPSECTSAAYEPELIVFVQGEKRISVGGATLVCDASTFLLTSIDMPVISQVTKASREEPILALMLKLEMPTVREILSQEEFHVPEAASGTRGMAVGVTSVELLGACSRLLDLLDAPQDIPFLSNLIQREVIYRLLRGAQGKHLRSIATLGEQSNRTARAVAWLKENYAKPLRVEDLASVAQMGVSTLHHHFRSLTAMSPLQYQKQLRLHTARVRMLMDGLDAASAAFEVGYESPTQFSREYRRFFGQPPMRDIKVRRGASAVTGLDSLEA